MNWLFFVAIAVLAVCMGYLVYLAITAPAGYEDEEGFHLGAPVTLVTGITDGVRKPPRLK